MFHHGCMDGMIGLSEVEDQPDLIAAELDEVGEDISQCVGAFYWTLIKAGVSNVEGQVGDQMDWSCVGLLVHLVMFM